MTSEQKISTDLPENVEKSSATHTDEGCREENNIMTHRQHTHANERNRRAWRALLLYAMVAISITGAAGNGAAAADAPVYYAICTPNGEINIRQRANIHSPVIGRLFLGDAVKVSEWRSDGHRIWCRIDDVTEYGYGWVSSEYLIDTEPVVIHGGRTAAIEATGRVAIRNAPGGKRIAWAQPGDNVTVIVSAGSWCLTSDGYIAAEYVRMEAGGQ